MQLLFLPLAALLGAESFLTGTAPAPQSALLRLPLSFLPLLGAYILLALYGYCVHCERERGLWALCRSSRKTQETAFSLSLVAMPFLLFAGWTPMIWDGRTHHGLVGALLIQAVVLVLPLVAYALLWSYIRRHGGWGWDDPDDDPEPGPSWWPDFEEQFSSHVKRSRERQPAGSRN